MPVYAKPFTSEMLVTDRKVKLEEGFIRVFEDKERPTPEHICSDDGHWVLPTETCQDVREKRARLYVTSGADVLLLDILASERLGQDVTEKTEQWVKMQSKVRTELPYPKE